jgi:hypothetical protein
MPHSLGGRWCGHRRSVSSTGSSGTAGSACRWPGARSAHERLSPPLRGCLPVIHSSGRPGDGRPKSDATAVWCSRVRQRCRSSSHSGRLPILFVPWLGWAAPQSSSGGDLNPRSPCADKRRQDCAQHGGPVAARQGPSVTLGWPARGSDAAHARLSHRRLVGPSTGERSRRPCQRRGRPRGCPAGEVVCRRGLWIGDSRLFHGDVRRPYRTGS